MNKEKMLSVDNLSIYRDDRKVLSGINLEVSKGEIHIVMGPNGSGKSTLALALMGYPSLSIKEGQIKFKNEDITNCPTEKRFQLGMFLALQQPPAIDGLSSFSLIRKSAAVSGKQVPLSEFRRKIKETEASLKLSDNFHEKNVNVDMSGGEKKKNEILQLLMAKPDLAILDEIDSGLDVPAIKNIAEILSSLRDSGMSFVIITHYERLLKYLKPDKFHIIKDGTIAFSGEGDVFEAIEKYGFDIEKIKDGEME